MYVCSEGRFPERTPKETSVAGDETFAFCEHLPETEPKKIPPWMETVNSLVPAAFSGKVIGYGTRSLGGMYGLPLGALSKGHLHRDDTRRKPFVATSSCISSALAGAAFSRVVTCADAPFVLVDKLGN